MFDGVLNSGVRTDVNNINPLRMKDRSINELYTMKDNTVTATVRGSMLGCIS